MRRSPAGFLASGRCRGGDACARRVGVRAGRAAGGWRPRSETEQAKLTASDGAGLGQSVAISGDTVVAGGAATVNGHQYQGAAYVFVKPHGGWASETEQAKLTASDGAFDDVLGVSVAISGDTVVAGAPNATVNGHFFQGAAYAFVKPHGGWKSETEQAKLTASDGGVGLGGSVAVSGDAVLAGEPSVAPGIIAPGTGQTGAVYVFGRRGPRTVTSDATAASNAMSPNARHIQPAHRSNLATAPSTRGEANALARWLSAAKGWRQSSRWTNLNSVQRLVNVLLVLTHRRPHQR